MANTIPANQLVNVQPSVVGTGGSALSLNAVFLTDSEVIPPGTVFPFYTETDIKTLFGPESKEAASAKIYFKGFTGANIQPGVLYMMRYVNNTAGASAWLRGATLNHSPVDISHLSGDISLEVNGNTVTATDISLTGAESFTEIVAILQTELGNSVAVTYSTQLKAFQINTSAKGAVNQIGYATGSLAEQLGLTAIGGALLSPGADVSTPEAIMDAVIDQTQNWATFMHVFNATRAQKLAFANWVNDQNLRYAYVMWDDDSQATVSPGGSLGAELLTLGQEGIIPVYNDHTIAAFVCGTAASIDFTEQNGRITFAFKGQSGLTPSVTSSSIADNLLINGYNFYGAYATATQQFNLFQNGQITGKWRWADAYINQIYLNVNYNRQS